MISIIMPTYNRFEIVRETIQKTLAISGNVDFEVIVVNDGEELPFIINHPKLRIYKNPKKGVSNARNFGAANASNPVLFFIDDDMWITPETLRLIMDFWQTGMLEDNYFNLNWVYPKELQEKLALKKIGRYILNSNYHTMEGRSFIKADYTKKVMDITGLGSCSFCINKENFIKAGGYNEDIEFQGEDLDMTIRLKNKNIHAKFATPITCYHNQEDRLEIEGYIDRVYRGFKSQAKAGMIKMTKQKQSTLKIISPFYGLFEWILKAIPNLKIFDKVTFRLIGILCSLTYLKAIQESKNNI
jgi:glycosyltransferase involved in cell wall biosynthesis